MSMPGAPSTHADPLGLSGQAVPFRRSPSSRTYTESARTRFVCPFLFVAMDRMRMPVLLMKSLTSIAGDMPSSSSLNPASVVAEPDEVGHDRNVDDPCRRFPRALDRKSTRLNSSHLVISYAVF